MSNYSEHLVVVHCNPSMLPTIEKLGYNWSYSPKFGSDEVDLILMDDAQLEDEELCTSYGLDYDLVHCVEAHNFTP